jgi:polysaccharide pyruvyl transferase WcaK-like protein
MKKIAFSGYYGMANYGDDLFCVASVLGAERYWPGCRSRLVCPRIEDFDAQYSYPDRLPSQWFQYHNPVGQMVRACTLISSALSVDHLVFAGGSIFNTGRLRIRNLVYWARKVGLKYSAIGVSVGPFNTGEDEEIVREQLKSFEYISLRDQASYERVCSYGLDVEVVQSADLAGVLPGFLETEKHEKASDASVVTVGFSPCRFANSSGLDKAFSDMFVEAIGGLARRTSVKVHIVCLNEHYKGGDLWLCSYVRDQLQQIGVASTTISLYRKLGILATWRLISSFDAYIGVRLHGAVSAYLCGVPFFLFEYQEKCAQFLDSVGKDTRERVPLDDCNASEVARSIERVLFSPVQPVVAPALYCQMSDKNFSRSPLCRL